MLCVGFHEICAKPKCIVAKNVIRKLVYCYCPLDTLLEKLERIENLSIGLVPIAAYIDPQELVVNINKAH